MLKLGLANVDVSACAEASIKAAVLVELLCSENAPPDRTSKWKRADWMVKADEVGIFLSLVLFRQNFIILKNCLVHSILSLAKPKARF